MKLNLLSENIHKDKCDHFSGKQRLREFITNRLTV